MLPLQDIVRQNLGTTDPIASQTERIAGMKPLVTRQSLDSVILLPCDACYPFLGYSKALTLLQDPEKRHQYIYPQPNAIPDENLQLG
jgi:hypothetical protein